MRALKDLVKEVDGLKYSCHASSILDTEDLSEQLSTVTIKNNKVLLPPNVSHCSYFQLDFQFTFFWSLQPLEDRLHLYQEDSSLLGKHPNLTHFPPDFEPIACKPLFFDIALSLVEYPSLEDKLDQKKQGGGLTGFVKGWLWGGGKK